MEILSYTLTLVFCDLHPIIFKCAQRLPARFREVRFFELMTLRGAILRIDKEIPSRRTVRYGRVSLCSCYLRDCDLRFTQCEAMEF